VSAENNSLTPACQCFSYQTQPSLYSTGIHPAEQISLSGRKKLVKPEKPIRKSALLFSTNPSTH
jgi:hypothetical protein